MANVDKCDYCNKSTNGLPHQCRFCYKIHCNDCLLPENHKCLGLIRLQRKMQSKISKDKKTPPSKYGIRHDPQEDDLSLRNIFKESNKETEERLKDFPRQIGFCHKFWSEKKKILKKKGIDWKTPAEMNPNVYFD